MKNNNFKFKELGNKIKLSKAEKEIYRDKMLEFINKETFIQKSDNKKSIASPFYFGLFIRRHLVLTSLVIILFLSTGLMVSADHAIPNDYLYQMRIKVIEPAQILLAPTAEKKNNLRVKFVDKSLNDFSSVSLKENINQEDKEALIESVSINIENLNNEINNSNKENNPSNSLKTANDLKSVLSSHKIILDKISETNPEITDAEILSLKIDEELDKTENIINTLAQKIQTPDDTNILDQKIDDQKEKINISLLALQNDIKMAKDSKSNSIVDLKEAEEKFTKIKDMTEEFNIKLEQGEKEKAIILYDQIIQKIDELELFIKINQENNIEIPDEKLENKKDVD